MKNKVGEIAKKYKRDYNINHPINILEYKKLSEQDILDYVNLHMNSDDFNYEFILNASLYHNINSIVKKIVEKYNMKLNKTHFMMYFYHEYISSFYVKCDHFCDMINFFWNNEFCSLNQMFYFCCLIRKFILRKNGSYENKHNYNIYSDTYHKNIKNTIVEYIIELGFIPRQSDYNYMFVNGLYMEDYEKYNLIISNSMIDFCNVTGYFPSCIDANHEIKIRQDGFENSFKFQNGCIIDKNYLTKHNVKCSLKCLYNACEYKNDHYINILIKEHNIIPNNTCLHYLIFNMENNDPLNLVYKTMLKNNMMNDSFEKIYKKSHLEIMNIMENNAYEFDKNVTKQTKNCEWYINKFSSECAVKLWEVWINKEDNKTYGLFYTPYVNYAEDPEYFQREEQYMYAIGKMQSLYDLRLNNKENAELEFVKILNWYEEKYIHHLIPKTELPGNV